MADRVEETSTNQVDERSPEDAAEKGGEEQEGQAEERPINMSAGTVTPEAAFRPLTRMERRNLWITEYGEQDFALQMWTRLVEQQDLEIEMMLQMHGLLIFGVMVSTLRFSSFKTVGTRSRSMRTIIIAVGVGMLIFLYSRYVLLVLIVGYILHGLLSRLFGMFRRRPELSEANVQAKLN